MSTDEKALAVVLHWDSGHDGPGWYYYDESYPDEGSVGAFTFRQDAETHAREGGYRVEETK